MTVDESLNRKCTNEPLGTPAKRRRLFSSELDDDSEDEIVSYASLEVHNFKEFKPISLLAEWL